MATASRNTDPPRVSLKGIVKYLGRFYPIAMEDVTSPNSEKTMDLLWNLCCHIYGEAELLNNIRGKEGPRLLLSSYLRSLFDSLMPSLNPPFTMKDLVFPTKERLVVLLNILVQFLKVMDEQSHIRDKILQEKNELLQEQEKLQTEIADTVERTHVADSKRQKNIELCSKLHDRFLTLDTTKNHRTTEVAAIQAEVEKKKNIIQQEKIKESELREEIRKVDEKITYFELNTLPPKAEFEEKLNQLQHDVNELEERMSQKSQRMRQLNKKLDQNTLDKSSAKKATAMLEETQQLQDKHLKMRASCLEEIEALERSRREVQSELMNCEDEMSRCSLVSSNEIQSLELRLTDIQRDNDQLEVVREDLASECKLWNSKISRIQMQLAALESQTLEEDKSFKRMLALDKKAREHLDILSRHHT